MAAIFEMRDGSTTTDPRLGRLKQFDERSRNFAYRAVAPIAPPVTKVWGVPWPLNQLSDGTCVGHGFEHEAGSMPVATKYSHEHALAWFDWAAAHDEFPGSSRANGTSVLAGAKYGVFAGYFKEYRWAFTLDEMMAALSNEGPLVVGTEWLDRMFQPGPDCRLQVEGSVAGGHCWLIYGLILPGDVNPMIGAVATEPVFLMQNSWGPEWGIGGRAWLTAADFDKLRLAGGEVCIPMGRLDPTAPPAPAPPKPAPKRRPKWVWSRYLHRWIQVITQR